MKRLVAILGVLFALNNVMVYAACDDEGTAAPASSDSDSQDQAGKSGGEKILIQDGQSK